MSVVYAELLPFFLNGNGFFHIAPASGAGYPRYFPLNGQRLASRAMTRGPADGPAAVCDSKNSAFHGFDNSSFSNSLPYGPLRTSTTSSRTSPASPASR